MQPEEKFKNDLLYVLAQIKKKSLYTLKGKPVEYQVDYHLVVATEKYPTAENEASILEKLQELEAIRIISRQNSPSDIMVEAEIFYLEIIEPKFSEIYEELRQPELKKELYAEKSAESIKKIIFILDKLKDEWDLTPKNYPAKDSMIQAGIIYRHEKNGRTSISHETTSEWVRQSGLKDFYQLDNILDILLEEGLILEATFRGEYE